MATFQEVQDRINNECLNRGTFQTETKTAIKAAIRHYEKRRWAFNETSVAVATSAGVGHVALPNNFLRLDHLQITVNDEELDLFRRSKSWILQANATRAQAQPTDYAIYQGRINLSAIPDAAYALPVHFIKKLPILDSAGSTNAFLEGEFEDVICYHAAKLVWGLSIRNTEEARKFAALEEMAMMSITEHIEQYIEGKIEPTEF